MSILEEKLESTYNAREYIAPFSKQNLDKFINYVNSTVTESKFLNPYLFSEKYNIDFDRSLSIFLFFSDDETSVLKIAPVIECFDDSCKNTLYINQDSQYVYCRDCDQDIDITLFKRYIKFLFKINPELYNLHKMEGYSDSYQKVTVNEFGLKHFPPSDIYEITPQELEGGVSFDSLNRINGETDTPLSSSFNDMQKMITQAML